MWSLRPIAAVTIAYPATCPPVDHLNAARALLEASEAGSIPANAERKFDNLVQKAEGDIDKALEAIARAKTVSDGGN
jgi:hypothetical protein